MGNSDSKKGTDEPVNSSRNYFTSSRNSISKSSTPANSTHVTDDAPRLQFPIYSDKLYENESPKENVEHNVESKDSEDIASRKLNKKTKRYQIYGTSTVAGLKEFTQENTMRSAHNHGNNARADEFSDKLAPMPSPRTIASARRIMVDYDETVDSMKLRHHKRGEAWFVNDSSNDAKVAALAAARKKEQDEILAATGKMSVKAMASNWGIATSAIRA